MNREIFADSIENQKKIYIRNYFYYIPQQFNRNFLLNQLLLGNVQEMRQFIHWAGRIK